ncbi:unnamed protein product [Phyllotreta striolata]|uniref:Fatty acyl-CoA reductase n=1 Tax=Phyllotreta striolata TaxID=444603 RepID=A0A9N9TJG8_PHYSR|nr:unnamed protein product [Phyllotreta striolata]
MQCSKSSSEGVKRFYKDKNIFITGGSGFVGICLLEKILRTIPDHGTIYLLMRKKRGKDIEERLDEIKKNSVFEGLLKDKSIEEVFSKVKVIAGDVGEENLGISTSDWQLLTENVQVIFHSAATLDFGDTLDMTVNINLLGTRRVTKLAKECRNLSVLVHVSSAYVNSYRTEADEVIYPLPREADELIAIVKKLNADELQKETPKLLGDHPNTYTITKHMAEHEIQKCQSIFPCTIVRPSMIVGAWKEPMPGWTISKNGPQGFMMGAAKGVIRRLPVAKELIYDYIPVDIVINNLIAAGFYTGVTKPSKVSIYHATSSTRLPFHWADVEHKFNVYLHNWPLKSAVWYPHMKFLPSITWYKISALFVHFFPAIILDTVARLTGGRPILVKLHKNVNKSLGMLSKFIFSEWKFHSNKTDELQKWLNQSDRETFNISLEGLIWCDYFGDLAKGSRVYLNKEPMKNLSKAKTKDNILLGVHVLWQVLLFSLLWFVFASFTGMTMSSSAFFVPICYILFNLL